MIPGAIVLLSAITFGQQGMIAFITGPTQAEYRLTILNVQTGEITGLGQGENDAYPRWSPDGNHIAYQSKQPDGTGIRIAYPLEQQDKSLKHRFKWNYRPSWSPCSQKIAYSSDGDEAPLQCIIVRNIETDEESIWGGTHRGLFDPIWLPTTDLMKALDPDDPSAAEELELVQLKTESEEFGALTAIGLTGELPRITTELFIITPSRAIPVLPFLADDSRRYVKYKALPDHKGRQIAYESNDGGDREIFVLGRRGITNVSNHRSADWNPVWSPDANWLAFESFRDGRRGIYRLLASTANVMLVTVGNTYNCWSPDWSPDGKWLVFVSDMTGIAQLYIIRPDGSGLTQLTHGAAPALSPVWQPRAK